MKPRHALLVAVAFAVFGSHLSSVSAQTSTLNVSLVFDPAGRYDHGKNQSAQDGADRAVRDFGVNVDTYTPLDASDNKAGTLKLAKEGSNLVIGVGSFHMAGLTAAAQQYPKTHFALVDGLPPGSNTAGIRFRDTEGAFLAGYIAGSSSATAVVGIVAETQSPATDKFVAAYHHRRTSGVFRMPRHRGESGCRGQARQGHRQGQHPVGRYDECRGRRGVRRQPDRRDRPDLGGSQPPVPEGSGSARRRQIPFRSVRGGAQVRRLQGGLQGIGPPVFFIGWQDNNNVLGDTDADPSTLNHGLTSIVRRVDNAVYSVIRDMVKGQVWRPGERAFGLQNGGLEYAVDKYNTALFPKAVTDRLAKVTGLVVSGSVKIGQ